jgi:hypothetical protein
VTAPDAGPLAVLQRIRRPPARPRPGERCELCGEDVPDEHGHLVDLESRRLMCACRPCAVLFTGAGAGGPRFRAVPERTVALAGHGLSPAEWETLDIPVGVAFLFTNSEMGRAVACYPSPAGATESLLPLGTWEDIVALRPALADVEADVEAVLVRVEHGESESFIVPIDVCYQLVGHLRRMWTGFDGGTDARRQLTAFFDELRARARPLAVPLPLERVVPGG